MPKFAERFAELIRAQGWTQVEAAEKLGISQALISRYLSGKREPLSRTVDHIAERLGVSVADLTGEKGSEAREKISSSKKLPLRESKPDKPTDRAMKDLRRRWKAKPHDRDTIRHLVAALFPNDAGEVLAWLEQA